TSLLRSRPCAPRKSGTASSRSTSVTTRWRACAAVISICSTYRAAREFRREPMTMPIVRRSILAFAAMATLGAASAAYAHHSFAMFDSESQIKLKGKVTDFQWQNPHVYIEIDAQDVNAKDKVTKSWTIECANPGILNRIGWKFNMVKV